MNIKNCDGIAKAIIKKLDKRHICLLDYKTNEKIAIEYELNQVIRKYYEKKQNGTKETL